MTKLQIILDFALATCIFVSWYFIFVAFAIICEAQEKTLWQEVLDNNQPFYKPSTQPLLPIAPAANVPVYVVNPVGNQNIPYNPYGTGYSVVTTERVGPDYVQQYLGNRNAVSHTTVTSVVPNNAWGQPIRPINPFWP